MDSTIVNTKLYIPAPQVNTVNRDRLIKRIDKATASTRLTLLSAPTGFGKTTLLSQWAKGKTVAWVSLEEQEKDPARFFGYLAAAMQTVEVGLGDDLHKMLKPEQPLQPELIMTKLINEIDEQDEVITLILDDYHVIPTSGIHRAMAFLVDQCPDNLRIIIATRTDPPLPLATLRVRQHITEVRTADLRFTREETASFFKQALDDTLDENEIAALEDSTEGWVAGLQLAALSMRGRSDFQTFLEAFTGSHRHILDYLAVEVLQKQEPAVQEFLLKTSLLRRLTADLCNAVTGDSNGRDMLARLERNNLFLVPLDGERRWFRYHHLFAGFLQEYLEYEHPEQIRDLHLAAATWYEENGLEEDAVHHALAAEDYERVIRLLDSVAYVMWSRGELATLAQWLEALPHELIQARPRLRVYYAWALVTLEEINAVANPISLHMVERQRTHDERSVKDIDIDAMMPDLPGLSEAMKAAISALRGDTSRTVAHSQQALRHLGDDEQLLRAIISLNLGFTYREARDPAQAVNAYNDAAKFGIETDNLYIAQIATNELAQIHMWHGDLRNAAKAFESALEVTKNSGDYALPMVCEAHTRIGLIYSEWDEPVVANHHLLEAIRLSKRFHKFDVLAHTYIGMAMMRRCQGNLEGALSLVEQARSIASDHALLCWVKLAEALQARLFVATGELEKAIQWAWESGLSIDDEISHHTQFEHLTLSRILVEQGKTEDALHLLGRLFALAEHERRATGKIRALAGMALAHQRQGALDEAIEHLEEALLLAEPQRYVYSFVEEGAPMAKLLMRVMQVHERQHNTSTYSASLEYVRRLLAVFGEARVAKSLQSQPLDEPLSEREMEVLHLMAGGMSNREIAEELVISVGTAKWHTKNIYRKLNVHSRTQAIAYARQINILR